MAKDPMTDPGKRLTPEELAKAVEKRSMEQHVPWMERRAAGFGSLVYDFKSKSYRPKDGDR